jgi:hypothetical protein
LRSIRPVDAGKSPTVDNQDFELLPAGLTGQSSLLEHPAKSDYRYVALGNPAARELNLLVGRSKRLTVGRPVKVSFRERKVALRRVPEANGFGTILRRQLKQPRSRAAKQQLTNVASSSSRKGL